MSSLTETNHAGEFILSKAPGNLSFDNITIKSGEGELEPGTVLAKDGDNYVAWDEDESATAPAVAILLGAVDATSSAVKAVALTRLAEVNGESLVWPSTAAADDKADAIANLESNSFIVVR